MCVCACAVTDVFCVTLLVIGLVEMMAMMVAAAVTIATTTAAEIQTQCLKRAMTCEAKIPQKKIKIENSHSSNRKMRRS